MPASYFLGSRFLGTSIRHPAWSDTEEADCNLALFCQSCGEVWARVIRHETLPWQPVNRPCARHFTGSTDAAGSFIAPWRRTYTELPPEVLRYECQLRLDRYKEES